MNDKTEEILTPTTKDASVRIIHIHYHIRHSWLSAILNKFNTDPKVQYKIHIVFTYIWIVNMFAAISIFIFGPGIWAKYSVLYLVLVSLYANFATDYGAVPGAEAAISAEEIRNQ
jgi:hypothetical protein